MKQKENNKFINEETKIANAIKNRYTVKSEVTGISPAIVKDIAEEFNKTEAIIKDICFKNGIKVINDDNKEVKSIDGISKAIHERRIL